MNSTFLLTYLTINILLALGMGLAYLLSKVNKYLPRLTFQHELLFNYLLLVSICVAPLFLSFFSKSLSFLPSPQIFTGISAVITMVSSNNLQNDYVPAMSITSDLFSCIKYLGFGQLVFFFPILIGFCWLIRDVLKLKRLLSGTNIIKRIKSLHILSSSTVPIPFSVWFPGKTFVFLPLNFLLDSHSRSMAMRHEFQHYRQHDLQLVYVFWAIKIACFWNPFVHLWLKHIFTLQEFACDEVLIRTKRVSSIAYGRCLVNLAASLAGQKAASGCALGLAFWPASQPLKRRLFMILLQKIPPFSHRWLLALGAIALFSVVFSASIVHSAVSKRPFSYEEVSALVEKAKKETSFPLAMNNSVKEQFNFYLGTPEGRKFVKDSLERMKKYEPMIKEKLQKNNLPLELLAIPFVESGYQNISHQGKSYQSAGIWMFVVPTAQTFGLQVDDKKDERLNPLRETDAAMDYLTKLYQMFGDWELAILSYNVGEMQVKKGLSLLSGKDRSAWTLINRGYQNDKDYLAKFMAMTVILKNQDIIN